MIKPVKCDTCKNFCLTDAPPWCRCNSFENNIPAEYYQTELEEQSKCPHFEYNPDWDKD